MSPAPADPNPRGFASDNHSGVHPLVMDAIVAANHGHTTAYGADPWTAAAHARLREHFGEGADPYLVYTGTGANVLALRQFARPGDAVICASSAHINVDEAGAAEAIAGVKLLPVNTKDGKLTPELAETPMQRLRLGDPHSPQPRAISISQATELGTVYTPEEVRALADFAHAKEMLLHIDGARLANAAAHLDASLAAITTEAGADFVCFGGTKNGLLGGEAVVFAHPGLGKGFASTRMQGTQLASKMRFLGAQFDALLSGDLWRQTAAHANAMATKLAARLAEIDGVILPFAVESNAVFVVLPGEAVEPLKSALPGDLPFHSWGAEESGLIRLMCSWDTTAEDVDALVSAAAEAIAS